MTAPDTNPPVILRPYQERQIEEIRARFRQFRRVLLQSPTGSGKTTVFTWLARAVSAKGKRVCILVHRKELLRQAAARLELMGVPHGIIDASSRHVTRAQVVVASVQTLARRLAHYRDCFDLLIIDEAHHAVAGTWLAVLQAMPSAYVLGPTATPQRLDGRGLGDVFEDMVLGPPVRELITDGHLSDYVAFAPAKPLDMAGIKTKMGDYDLGQLAEMMSRTELVGDAVEHYQRHADGRPAVAFCVSVKHAELVAGQFRDAGYAACAVDGSLDQAERDRRIAGLGNGQVQVLTSCELISEGLDIPAIATAILLRPTQSLGMHLQQIGRALRPKPDGSRAVILDHAGNILRHGLPCQPREWKLTSTKQKGKRTPSSAKQCKACYAWTDASATKCPECGAPFGSEPRVLEQTAGQLVEIKPRWYDETGRPIVDRTRKSIDQAVAECKSWSDLTELRKSLGFKHGWEFNVGRSLKWTPLKNQRGITIMMIPPRDGQRAAG